MYVGNPDPFLDPIERGKHLRYDRDMEERLQKIATIIESVDDRCAAADGPVTPTHREITLQEIQAIYKLAKERRR